METTKRDAVDELLQTYSETGGINYLDAAANLPSRPAIESACADLMSLMFPGFRGEALVDSGDLPDVTRSRMRNLRARLKTEICRSLGKIPSDKIVEAKAEEILSSFLGELPQRLHDQHSELPQPVRHDGRVQHDHPVHGHR